MDHERARRHGNASQCTAGAEGRVQGGGGASALGRSCGLPRTGTDTAKGRRQTHFVPRGATSPVEMSKDQFYH